MSGAGTAESTDDSARARKHRGFIFAMVADVSASLGFVFSGLVPLLLLLCFHEREEHYKKVWRIAFALGLIVSQVIYLLIQVLMVLSLQCQSSGSGIEWQCLRQSGAALLENR